MDWRSSCLPVSNTGGKDAAGGRGAGAGTGTGTGEGEAGPKSGRGAGGNGKGNGNGNGNGNDAGVGSGGTGVGGGTCAGAAGMGAGADSGTGTGSGSGSGSGSGVGAVAGGATNAGNGTGTGTGDGGTGTGTGDGDGGTVTGAGEGKGAGKGATTGIAIGTVCAITVIWPQILQNLAVLLLTVPHLLQLKLAGGVVAGVGNAAARVRKSKPQLLQNFAVSLISAAHFGQVIVMFSLSLMYLSASLRKRFKPSAYFFTKIAATALRCTGLYILKASDDASTSAAQTAPLKRQLLRMPRVASLAAGGTAEFASDDIAHTEQTALQNARGDATMATHGVVAAGTQQFFHA